MQRRAAADRSGPSRPHRHAWRGEGRLVTRALVTEADAPALRPRNACWRSCCRRPWGPPWWRWRGSASSPTRSPGAPWRTSWAGGWGRRRRGGAAGAARADRGARRRRRGLAHLRAAAARAWSRRAQQLDVRRVALVAADLSGRGRHRRAHRPGRPGPRVRRRRRRDRAGRRRRAASPRRCSWGTTGGPTSGPTPAVGPPGDVAGFVVVEASADYLTSLARFRRWLVAAGALGLALIVLFDGAAGPAADRAAGAAGRRPPSASAAASWRPRCRSRPRDEVGLLAARLDEMRAALRARDERLQMMLAGIAHEVRNPLGGLELYAGLLRESLAGAARAAGRGGPHRARDRLPRRTWSPTSWSTRAGPRPELRRCPAARRCCDEVVEVARGGTAGGARRGRGARRPGGPGRPRPAAAGAAQPGAQRHGGGRLRRAGWCWRRTRPQDGGVRVRGARQRPGRARPSCARRSSSPFFTTREKGTGLGLAFVREIVRDHGGDVAVDQAPGGRRPLSLSPARRPSLIAYASRRRWPASSSSTTTRPCARAWPPPCAAWGTRR